MIASPYHKEFVKTRSDLVVDVIQILKFVFLVRWFLRTVADGSLGEILQRFAQSGQRIGGTECHCGKPPCALHQLAIAREILWAVTSADSGWKESEGWGCCSVECVNKEEYERQGAQHVGQEAWASARE